MLEFLIPYILCIIGEGTWTDDHHLGVCTLASMQEELS